MTPRRDFDIIMCLVKKKKKKLSEAGAKERNVLSEAVWRQEVELRPDFIKKEYKKKKEKSLTATIMDVELNELYHIVAHTVVVL